MASKSHVFSLSGPLHLTAIDWKNPHHRRSIAAALVQAVYVLEHDRQQGRYEHNALAPPWWDFFHLHLNRELKDDTGPPIFGAISIFGAIFEFKNPNSHLNPPGPHPPRYIIAFRGTLTEKETWARDLRLDLRLVCNKLQKSPCFHLAIQVVQKMVSIAGASNVWLAGHSLGSAISLLVGRHMVKMGYHLETYLFNPPFISIPTKQIKNDKLEHAVRFTSSIIKAGLAATIKSPRPNKSEENEPFAVLSSWIPYLFLNPMDPFCSEYIGYFDHRVKMENIGAGKIERLATQNSFRSMVWGALGRDSEPSHLIPSAYLTINLGPSQDLRQAHGVEQWWSPNLSSQSESKLHQFK